MGDWLSIILLLVVGLVLIYLELIFVPGTTFLGILGLLLTGVGIYIAFDTHGASTGYMVLAGSFVVTLIALIYSFKSRTWDRFALKGQNTATVNAGYADELTLEMRGETLSDLKPIGKAEFNNKTYEVTSNGHLIEAHQQVRIININRNKIVVELINS